MNKASSPIHAETSPSHGHFTIAPSQAPSKIARILAYMVYGESLNRFEAERIGDHCLHSTISKLANSYGLNFQRQTERVPNHWGTPCDVTRYSLPASEHKRAHAVLLMLCKPAKGQKVAA